MDKFKAKELPRVIYLFLKDDNKKIMDLEELDGVFYLPKKETLKINDLPFIIDDRYEAHNSKFEFMLQNNDYIQFDKNSLVLLEVKNRFPGTNNASSKKQIDNELRSELINLLDKVLAFYELYNERFENIEKIMIILFYDVIPKSNYDEVLSNVFNKYFYNKRLIEIKNKIQFQCTFIISSYFAYTIKNFFDKINAIELKMNENERKLDNEMASLKKNLHKIKSDHEKEANDYKTKYLLLKNKYSNGFNKMDMNGKNDGKRK